MSSLDYDIRLLFDRPIDSKSDRVWLSNGTKIVEQLCNYGPSNVSYVEGAIIPDTPWRNTDTSTLNSMLGDDREIGKISSTVRITKVPEKLLDPFFDLGLDTIESQEDIPKLSGDSPYGDAVEGVVSNVEELLSKKGDIKVLGLSVKQPRLPTVTVDRSVNQRIGLHLDSWDQLPLAQRDRARNRLSINLGREDRFLLFVDATVSSILDALNDGVGSEQGATGLMREFMASYSDVSVVKVKIRPGEAYIAPTENIIHDATTLDKDYVDISLSMLGRFRTNVCWSELGGKVELV